MLPEMLTASACLDLTYRADLQLLVARWRRQATTEELQATYFALLEAAVAKSCPRWLLDVRGRADSNAAYTAWMMTVFFPQLPQHFREPVRLAYLFAPNHLRELETDERVPPLTWFDDKPYRVQRFVEEAAAVRWLGEVKE